MKRRLRFALLFVTLFAVPFSQPVQAGHVGIGGEYCTCGCAGCICDPGETRQSCIGGFANRQTDLATPGKPVAAPEFDGGSLILLFGVALALYFRR